MPPSPGDPVPAISIVVCTYNREVKLRGAVEAALNQDFDAFEVVVVDDGSTDGTRNVVEAFADPRVRYVHRSNGGLSAARNTGLTAALGTAVAFVDDDDRPTTGWARQLAAPFADERCAVSFCGARHARDGFPPWISMPADLGAIFDHHVGLILAGTFAVRRTAALGIGGFAEDVRCSHQTEFMLRLLPQCTERGWTVVATHDALVQINWSAPTERLRNDPERLLACTEMLIRRHSARLQRQPRAYANYAATCGVCSARLGRHDEARRWFLEAFRWDPSPRHVARMIAATVPPVGRRLWRSKDYPPSGDAALFKNQS